MTNFLTNADSPFPFPLPLTIHHPIPLAPIAPSPPLTIHHPP